MPVSTRSSKEELLFFLDPTRLERSIREGKHAASIDINSSSSIDTYNRTSIDTNLQANMIETLVLQRDENRDMHDLGGHLCNAEGQKVDS